MGGFIGYIKSSHAVGLELHAEGCSISGTIQNETPGGWQRMINPYIGSANTSPVSLEDHVCTNTLTSENGVTTGFKYPKQTLDNLKKQ